MSYIFSILALIFCCETSHAIPKFDGYITDVQNEVSDEPIELVLCEKPDAMDGPSFNSLVFNHQLSQEFTLRYQQIFGRTEQEDNYHLLDRQGYQYVSAGVLSGTQLDSARQEFALYMSKRLLEYHSDNIMKNNPTFKKVYEIKQAVSNVNLAVNDTTKFDMSYTFLGNLANFKMTHAISDILVTLVMDPASFTPTAPRELIITQQKKWSSSVHDEIALSTYAKFLRMTLFKDLSPDLSVNYTQTVALSENLMSRDMGRESLSIAGLNLNF